MIHVSRTSQRKNHGTDIASKQISVTGLCQRYIWWRTPSAVKGMDTALPSRMPSL